MPAIEPPRPTHISIADVGDNIPVKVEDATPDGGAIPATMENVTIGGEVFEGIDPNVERATPDNLVENLEAVSGAMDVEHLPSKD